MSKSQVPGGGAPRDFSNQNPGLISKFHFALLWQLPLLSSRRLSGCGCGKSRHNLLSLTLCCPQVHVRWRRRRRCTPVQGFHPLDFIFAIDCGGSTPSTWTPQHSFRCPAPPTFLCRYGLDVGILRILEGWPTMFMVKTAAMCVVPLVLPTLSGTRHAQLPNLLIHRLRWRSVLQVSILHDGPGPHKSGGRG